MNDMKQLMERALPEQWDATGASSEAAILAGRTLRTRRRVGLAASATVAAAVAAVAVAVVPTLGAEPAPDSHAAAAPFDLPELDPSETYYWAGLDEDAGEPHNTKTVEAYRAALHEYVNSELPEIPETIETIEAEAPGWELYVEGSHFGLFRDVDGDFVNDPDNDQDAPDMAVDPDDELIHQEPVYSVGYEAKYGGGLLPTPEGGDVTVTVWPSGGFLAGPGESAAHLANCEPSERDVQANQRQLLKPTCSEIRDPDGEAVLQVDTKVTTDEHVHHEFTLVMYRSDGSAVVVEHSTQLEQQYLDFDQMLGLAASLPQLPVE
jgi:hypothetical protein